MGKEYDYFIYGEMPENILGIDFVGKETETANVVVDNEVRTIAVDVKKLPHRLAISVFDPVQDKYVTEYFDGSSNKSFDIGSYAIKQLPDVEEKSFFARYSLFKNGTTPAGDVIEIPLDRWLQTAVFDFCKSDMEDIKTGDPYLTFVTADSDYEHSDTIYCNLRAFQDSIDEKIEEKVEAEAEERELKDVWEAGEGEHSVQTKGTGCSAGGKYSVAEGWTSKTLKKGTDPLSGQAAHAEGAETNASGFAAHAEGGRTSAEGSHAHAEGYETTALGDDSHAEGNHTITNNFAEHAEGKFNVSHADSDSPEGNGTISSIGIGTAEIDPETGEFIGRKNAVEIMKNGDQYIFGIGGYEGKEVEGKKTLQTVVKDIIDTTACYIKIVAANETDKYKISLLNKAEEEISSEILDIDTEFIIDSAHLDYENKAIIFERKDGSQFSCDIRDLIDDLDSKIKAERARAEAKEAELEEAISQAGKIDDVLVDGISVVTDKIANIDLSGKQDILTFATNEEINKLFDEE